MLIIPLPYAKNNLVFNPVFTGTGALHPPMRGSPCGLGVLVAAPPAHLLQVEQQAEETKCSAGRQEATLGTTGK